MFSQFTGFLGKVRERLEAEGIPYCYLDGGTRDRAAVVRRFKDGVMVYRLVAKDTIEEKAMALKARKARLFSSVLDDGNAFGTAVDADDIRALLA